MFRNKDKKIEKYENLLKDCKQFIEDQDRLIKTMRNIIDSILEDNKSLLEIAYKTSKKRTSRPKQSN